MAKDDENSKKARSIIEAFDQVLSHPNWQKTLFLRAIGQKLQEIRDKFRRDVRIEDVPESAAQNPSSLASRVAQREGQVEVFISLHCAQGTIIANWERILQGLHRQIVSRPIFQKEDELRELIRAKPNPKNEAYVCAYVPESAVMAPASGRQPTDVLGHKLLILKDNSVRTEQVTRFVHASGEYNCVNGKLILRQADDGTASS